MFKDLPYRSLISILIPLVFMFVFAIGMYVTRNFYIFFTSAIVCVTIVLVISVSKLYQFRKDRKVADDANMKNIEFVSCPDYWTTYRTPTSTTCANSFKGQRIGQTDQTLDLSTLNNLENSEKCDEASNYVWTEAENKC